MLCNMLFDPTLEEYVKKSEVADHQEQARLAQQNLSFTKIYQYQFVVNASKILTTYKPYKMMCRFIVRDKCCIV